MQRSPELFSGHIWACVQQTLSKAMLYVTFRGFCVGPMCGRTSHLHEVRISGKCLPSWHCWLSNCYNNFGTCGYWRQQYVHVCVCLKNLSYARVAHPGGSQATNWDQKQHLMTAGHWCWDASWWALGLASLLWLSRSTWGKLLLHRSACTAFYALYTHWAEPY